MNKYALTGAAFPMTIGKVEFQATSLTEKDYQEVDGYIQSKIMEIGRSGLKGLSQPDRQEMLQATIKTAACSGWGTAEGIRIINKVEGTCRLGWQMIKRKHPEVSFEDFKRKAIGSKEETEANLIEIDKVFAVLNIDDEDDTNGEAKEASSETSKSE